MKEVKLKIMGIEDVKSSTPAPCRIKIKEALKVIMNKDENVLIQFIDDFRTHFKKLQTRRNRILVHVIILKSILHQLTSIKSQH